AINLGDNAHLAYDGGTDSIHNESDGTITGNGSGAGTATIDVALDNDGVVTTTSGALTVTQIVGYNTFTETLSGGTWAASGTGALVLPGVNGISLLDATMSRTGAGAAIIDGALLDPLRDLDTITANGGVTVRNGASLTTPGPLTTAGAVHVGASSSLTSTGLYRQNSGSTTIEAASGSLTATGSRVDVHGGVLSGKGQVQSEVRALGGTINPVVGDVPASGTGILDVTGPGSLDASSGYAVRINGTTAGGSGVGLGYPQLTTSSSLDLGGTLTLSKGAAYTPVDGTTFTLATGASRSGSFDNIVSDPSFAGWRFTAANTATQARVTIHQVTGADVTATAAPTSSVFADGTPGSWKVTVTNLGTAATSGTVHANLTLGAGQTLGSAAGTGWTCSGSGPVDCTRSTAIAAGASAPPITVTATATGVSSTTLDVHVSGGNDAFTGDNDFTGSVPVKVLSVPVARIGPSTPTTGFAPLAVSLDASSSTCPITCTYQWDFGDGSTAVGLSVSHTYLTPGVYSATLKANNDELSDTDTLTITVNAVVPVVANPGDDRTVPPNTTLTLNGRASTPAPGGGVTYDWNFGDGSPHGTGAQPSHAWTTTGDKTVTLTVTRGVETSSATATVHVQTNVGSGLVTTVTNGSSPISGADVVVIDAAGTRYPGTTNGSGVATLAGIPDGPYTVFAWHDGYLPQKAAATVSGGNGTASMALASGSVAATTVEARRLSYDEIIAAGIDPNDPANQNVIHFTVCLAFADASCASSPQVSGFANGSGGIFGGGVSGGGSSGGSCTATVCSFTTADGQHVDYRISVPGAPGDPGVGTPVGPPVAQGVFIITPGKARWLKEFYAIKMVVANLAPEGFTFLNGHATLDLPDGVTLAPTTNPQTATQAMEDIEGGKDGSATWLVRGDTEGSYPITVHYTGSLDPIGSSLDLSATAVKNLRVWGLSALSITAAADTAATAHTPYHLRVRITNVTNTAPDPDDRIPVYNPAVILDRHAQGGLWIFQPDEQFEQTTAQLATGASFDANYVLIPTFTLPLNLGGSLVNSLQGEAAGTQGTVTPVSGLTPTTPGAFTATSTSDGIHLSWAGVAGATGYVIYRTPTDVTPFASPPVPLASVSAAGTGTQSATVFGTTSGAWYAISTVGANGVATMKHPLVQVAAGTCTGACATGGFVISTGTLPGGVLGHSYSATITAIGGTAPYKWKRTAGKLPKGLKLGATTGVISGTPKGTVRGTATFTVQARYKTKLPQQPAVWHYATKVLSITIS
ncbi:MAG: PKD domain-containing protein, partial [Acidimicrobiia bacterium]